jgi:hypothetical protein
MALSIQIRPIDNRAYNKAKHAKAFHQQAATPKWNFIFLIHLVQ